MSEIMGCGYDSRVIELFCMVEPVTVKYSTEQYQYTWRHVGCCPSRAASAPGSTTRNTASYTPRYDRKPQTVQGNGSLTVYVNPTP